MSLDEFMDDRIAYRAAEHEFQIAIQAALDIGSHILSEEGRPNPESYADVFAKLAEIGVVPSDFAERLIGMAKFRNILVHLYLEVSLERVYGYIQNDLGDFDLFARYIGEYLAKKTG